MISHARKSGVNSWPHSTVEVQVPQRLSKGASKQCISVDALFASGAFLIVMVLVPFIRYNRYALALGASLEDASNMNNLPGGTDHLIHATGTHGQRDSLMGRERCLTR